MPNTIQVCDKCKHMKMKTVMPKLKKIAPDATIKVGCKSYCGPCTRNAFIFINGRYVTGKDEDQAIEKAKKYVK
ncbi:DUF1450 domain-containing protein [Chengkuizengella axinellae]|uniref:DUF1450 domain-containing protein n=1 Tax=Chengkuizengella axinellae TaxID=3064388 RepID=A0ABT9J0D8_9BACL|nr:DUF1450 domain-containing protein [Chengkuizengella sp. 2205SS18-9]MDP5274484.1 DUF1450 domain-containing protein [Chengkuizengella sp. 2205SS18-9]